MSNKLLKPYRILYAEDDDMIRDGYVNYFKIIFQDVYEASNGQEAYDTYKKYRPDILLFDINMPYIDGLELIQKIREDDKKVKIIVLSAYTDEDKLLKAIKLGLVSYLKKPVKKAELDSVLNQTVEQLDMEKSSKKTLYLSDKIQWNRAENTLLNNSTEVHLTRNEIILLNILTSKSKTHYSFDDILEVFWQQLPQKEMSYDSIRNIIKRIKPKLPPGSIENFYGVGYRLSIKS